MKYLISLCLCNERGCCRRILHLATTPSVLFYWLNSTLRIDIIATPSKLSTLKRVAENVRKSAFHTVLSWLLLAAFGRRGGSFHWHSGRACGAWLEREGADAGHEGSAAAWIPQWRGDISPLEQEPLHVCMGVDSRDVQACGGRGFDSHGDFCGGDSRMDCVKNPS